VRMVDLHPMVLSNLIVGFGADSDFFSRVAAYFEQFGNNFDLDSY
jgi:hypothetical protein